MKVETAIKIMLSIVAALSIFHLCILFKIIPYEIAWGGRLKNDEEMYVFECASLLINFLLVFALLIKGKYIKAIFSMKLVNIILWLFLVLFALNTLGNILAKTNFEKFFSILTLASTLLIWVILKAKEKAPFT